MSDILAFGQLGFRHIIAWDAADHILFLLALAAIYRGRDWRSVVWVVTAFTIGHSVTLALAATGLLVAPARIVEFLIPVTIIATGVENLALRGRIASGPPSRLRPWLAGVFGLVHGAGFAGHLRSLFVDQMAMPLLGFNLGIEAAQIVVLVAAGFFLAGLDRLIATVPRWRAPSTAFNLRIVAVSSVVTVVAVAWAAERLPW